VNLVIDQGNTITKVGVFDNETLLDVFLYEKLLEANTCENLLQSYEIDRCVFSSVINVPKSILYYLENNIKNYLFLDKEVSLPISNNYRTPETLGADRLAAVVGAKVIYPVHNVLTIDIGTAITYDFIDSSNTFLGGNISPGINQRFKALHYFTDKLPLVDRYGDIPDVGYDTDTALRSGVLKGIVYEINSYIEEYKLRYTNIEVILTGGHSKPIQSELKNNIFVEPNLVLKGLNRILNYNIDK